MEIEQINSKPSCKNCSKIFSTNSILQIHNTIVHAQVKSFFHCQICQILFYTKTEFDLHIQEGHTQEGNTQEGLTQEGHTQEEILRTYSKTEQINLLHKKLKSEPSVTNSFKIKQVKVNPTLPKISVDKKISSIKCNICYKIFSRREHLARHIQTVHEKLKPYQCIICSKGFTRKDHLRVHNITVHEKVSLVSRKSFFRLQNQLSHKFSVCDKKRPIQCSICFETFSTKQCHDEHILTVHADLPKLECQICKRSYSSRGNLSKHTKVIHGNFEPVKLMHSSLKTNELRTEQL